MSKQELVAAVDAARSRLDEVRRRAWQQGYGAAIFAELDVAQDALADAERALARWHGDEVAAPYPWEVRWNRGAPMPHVVSSGRRTFLLYLADERDPAWDGTTARVVSPEALRSEPLALVELVGCYGHRFGGPSDEVFEGHPLTRAGFVGQGAYVIERSRWLRTEQQTNSVHAGYDPARWERRQHVMLAFHDDVFECICEGFRVERVRGTFQQMLARMVERVVAG